MEFEIGNIVFVNDMTQWFVCVMWVCVWLGCILTVSYDSYGMHAVSRENETKKEKKEKRKKEEKNLQ